MFVATLGAQPVSTGQAMHPLHGGLLGLARTVRSEQPTADLTYLDVTSAGRPAVCDALGAVSRAALAGKKLEPEVAVSTDVSRRVPRLAEAAQSLGGPIRMHFDARGAVSNLRIVPQIGARTRSPSRARRASTSRPSASTSATCSTCSAPTPATRARPAPTARRSSPRAAPASRI